MGFVRSQDSVRRISALWRAGSGGGIYGKGSFFSQKITPSVVYGYGEPREDNGHREAMIRDCSDLGNSSISHSGSRISTFLDLSELVIPPFCQFRYWKQDAGVEMDHEVLETQFGQKFEQLKLTGKGLKVNLCALSVV